MHNAKEKGVINVQFSVNKAIKTGIIGGIIGEFIFGMIMQMMGKIAMIEG